MACLESENFKFIDIGQHIRYCTTFPKSSCIKLQHTNDPDQTGPGKSYISI